jgi:hypothetical protein
MPGSIQPHGSPPTWTSWPVYTATTPDTAFALAALMPLIFAWACGLRTKAAYVMPGSFTSSTYWPRPVMNRGSSRRLIAAPKSRFSVAVAMASPHFPAIFSAAYWMALTMLW